MVVEFDFLLSSCKLLSVALTPKKRVGVGDRIWIIIVIAPAERCIRTLQLIEWCLYTV